MKAALHELDRYMSLDRNDLNRAVLLVGAAVEKLWERIREGYYDA